MKQKFAALLLCAACLVSMIGCGQTSAGSAASSAVSEEAVSSAVSQEAAASEDYLA